MNPTPQQQAVIDEVATGASSIAVIAVAGAGKTKTLELACAALPSSTRVLALAFNKKIKDEMERRLPSHVDCRTLNGLGHRAWTDFLGKRPTLNSGKLGDIAKDILKKSEPDQWWELIGNVRDLVSKAKHHGLVVKNSPGQSIPLLEDTEENWQSLADHYDISINGKEIAYAREVLLRSTRFAFSGEIDFDDQLYMSCCWRAPLPRYDIVLIDEAQDLSGIQHELLLRFKTRVIAVGDPHQAIYGFRGALSDSMSDLISHFNMIELPLSVSFRCARAVVQEAQRYVSHIEPCDTAPEGSVVRFGEYTSDEIEDNSLIVCRNNGPLIAMAYRLLSRGRSVTVLGRDIGKGLTKLIDKLGANSIDELKTRLAQWRQKEILNAQARGKDIGAIEDKAESLMAVIQWSGAKDVSELKRKIDLLFAKDVAKITLSTIHKAKGLEWPTVYFLDSWLLPSKWAIQEWMLDQENNLCYVAVTRAMQKLVYISSDNFDTEAPDQQEPEEPFADLDLDLDDIPPMGIA